MKKLFISLVLMLCLSAVSQNLPSNISILQNIKNTTSNFAINFDKKYYECENKWVFTPIKPENRFYFVDYIFLDPKEGYSTYSGGTIEFDANYNIKFFISHDNMTKVIYKCSNSQKNYALVPDDFLELINLEKDTPPREFEIPTFKTPIKHDLKVAQQLNELGENAKALSILEKIKRKSPNEEGLQLELMIAYNVLQNYDEAIKIVKTESNKRPEDIFLQNELAFAYFKKGEYDSALQIYNSIFDKFPDSEKLKKQRIAIVLSKIYMSKSDIDSSGIWLKKSFEYFPLPNNSERVNQLDSSYIDKNKQIVFKDDNLERRIKRILKKDSLSGVYLSEVENIRSINISNNYKSPNSEKIRNIDALKFFTNLDSISADYNLIRTIKPLCGLKKLKNLSFQNNSIADLLPVTNLNYLTSINFSHNLISNIWPLKILRNLKKINLFFNKIDDVTPLANQENIVELNLGMNRITSISCLKDKAALRILWLFGNKIADPEVVSSLPNLQVLSLAQCSIKDISFLSNCKNITSLMLFENEITDLKPLSSLINLEGLNLQKNKITDLSAIVELVRKNAFASNQRVFKYKLDVSDNPIDYSDNKNVVNRDFLKSQIEKSKF
jgi:Leucine-rich repeat (LRR) protein